MRVGSLFAGIGGFDVAAERAGMSVAWQSEVDPAASRVLKYRWPNVENLGDIHHVDPPVSAVDVLCGGFPCQDYSVAGRRGGLAGDRGALWWEFLRLITGLRPGWVVAENVPGLISSRGGRDFATIVDSLTDCGYGVVWRVFDAQWFGLAQRRRRVFIVGHSGGVPRPEVLAVAQSVSGDTEPSRNTGSPVAALTRNGVGGGGGPDDNAAQAGHLIVHATHGGVRRLTPVECERLQGFPDGWTGIPGNSDTQRYRQLGNAVAVPVAEWVLRRVAAGLGVSPVSGSGV